MYLWPVSFIQCVQVPQHYGPTPDDSGITTRLPSICVDYLSHDWAEEDTWASWKAMTRHKTEIANGKHLIIKTEGGGKGLPRSMVVDGGGGGLGSSSPG